MGGCFFSNASCGGYMRFRFSRAWASYTGSGLVYYGEQRGEESCFTTLTSECLAKVTPLTLP